jgi:phosphoribosylformylglycinamidine synthase
MAGHIGDAGRICTPGFRDSGDEIMLLGPELVSLAGSEYAQMRGAPVCGQPAALDVDLECRVQTVCRKAIAAGLLQSAHDCSEGGLAVAIVESALAGSAGAVIDAGSFAGPVNLSMFGEGPARVVVSAAPSELAKLRALADAFEVPLHRVGRVGGREVTWQGVFSLGLDDLSSAYDSALSTLDAPG